MQGIAVEKCSGAMVSRPFHLICLCLRDDGNPDRL